MNITFITVGKPSSDWSSSAMTHYTKFLSKYCRPEFEWVRAASRTAGSPAESKTIEAERLLKTAARFNGFKIACDSSGKTFTSEKFAAALRDGLDRHGGRAVIVVGGPWGLGQSVLKWSDVIWSFGPLTFPHELALVTAMEQVARAFSIGRNENYHK